MLRNLSRATCAILLSVFFMPLSASAAVQNGTLIKGKTSNAVYYVEAGKRYAFPNEQVFLSWYQDFSSVTTVSDADLASYTLTGNVRFRPGALLVKITTDPKVYAVSRYGVLRWVMSEQAAADLYGSNWSSIVRDVSDTLFINYLRGSDVGQSVDYNRNEEQSVTKITDDIRPIGYVPPVAQTSIPTEAAKKIATLSVVASTSQATLNQMVDVFAKVENSSLPLAKIELYADNETMPFATCLAATDCHGVYTVIQSPLTIYFSARGTDANGAAVTTPLSARSPLSVQQTSSDIQISISPQISGAGTRVSFTSDAHKFSGINNHKVYAAIPGEPNPVLLKDCGAESNCAASLPFYRTTQLFSKITTGGQTSQSASVTLSITGNGIPKPTLTLLSKPSPNQAVIKIDAPTGETIGFTTLVAGVTEGNTAVALCDQSTCEVTIQFSTPQQYTSFTDVGGKLESSNTLNLEP
ncbi:MAG: hypothetical protein AAB386_02450 [Patescibacteria group bacterium]|mgnify:FL=1